MILGNQGNHKGKQSIIKHKTKSNLKQQKPIQIKNLKISSRNNPRDNKKKNICRRCGDDWTHGHKCKNNEIIQCKIINGKEVQVSAQDTSSNSNIDTESK